MVTGVRGACVDGVVIADYRLSRQPELGAGIFPVSGVVFELCRAPQQAPGTAPPAKFPLSLRDFHFVGRGIGGPSPYQRELFFSVTGANYWAIAWIGRSARIRSSHAMPLIVASVRSR